MKSGLRVMQVTPEQAHLIAMALRAERIRASAVVESPTSTEEQRQESAEERDRIDALVNELARQESAPPQP